MMITEEKKKVLAHYQEGRRLYKLMDFARAKEAFLAALAVDPSDGPSKVYVERCEHYSKEPPADDWDGVWVMKTK